MSVRNAARSDRENRSILLALALALALALEVLHFCKETSSFFDSMSPAHRLALFSNETGRRAIVPRDGGANRDAATYKTTGITFVRTHVVCGGLKVGSGEAMFIPVRIVCESENA